MSNSRRNFIKKSAIGLSVIPTLGFISKSNKDSLLNITSSLSNLSNNSYWSEVRNLFPTKKNQTYFNNLPSWAWVNNREIKISSTEIRKQRKLLRS